MNDKDIRTVLKNYLSHEHQSDPETLVVDEMGLCEGDARVDLAVINGSIHGFEIKSDEDTLRRLPAQQSIYCRVLDQVTVVTTSRHLAAVRAGIPHWWGLSTVQPGPAPRIRQVRKARANPHVDPNAMVKLLWRDEALALLREISLHHGVSSKPRAEIWTRLVSHFSVFELSKRVRDALRARKGWR